MAKRLCCDPKQKLKSSKVVPNELRTLILVADLEELPGISRYYFGGRKEMAGGSGFLEYWRPVRESNPCRRREREASYCNSAELRGMASTLPHLKDSRER